MATTAEKKQPVVLTTSDEEEYTVDRNVAERSLLIKGMIEGESLICGHVMDTCPIPFLALS